MKKIVRGLKEEIVNNFALLNLEYNNLFYNKFKELYIIYYIIHFLKKKIYYFTYFKFVIKIKLNTVGKYAE